MTEEATEVDVMRQLAEDYKVALENERRSKKALLSALTLIVGIIDAEEPNPSVTLRSAIPAARLAIAKAKEH